MGNGVGVYVTGNEGGVISEMPDKYKKRFLNRHFKKSAKIKKAYCQLIRFMILFIIEEIA